MDYSYGSVVAYSVPQRSYKLPILLMLSLYLLGLFGFMAHRISSNVQLSSASLSPPQTVLAVAAAEQQPPQPEVITLPVVGAEAQQYIDSWVASHPKIKWSAVLTSLDDNSRVSVNADKDFEIASIYKLFLARELPKNVPVSTWAIKKVPGLLPARTYQQCVTAMIRISDNACAQAIGDSIGWSKLHTQLQTDGFTTTKFNTTDFIHGSASDTDRLLGQLYRGDGFDTTTQKLVLDAMATQKLVNGIPKGCSGICTVSNKTGDLNGNFHDAAIIKIADKHYALTVMSKGGSWPLIVQFTKGLVAVQNK